MGHLKGVIEVRKSIINDRWEMEKKNSPLIKLNMISEPIYNYQ